MKRSRRALLSGSLTDYLGPTLSKKAKEETPGMRNAVCTFNYVLSNFFLELDLSSYLYIS